MSKIIKKQIKRSVPYFLIFSLIFGFMVSGLVFNFDLKIKKNSDIELVVPKANAQNATTSTSVSVRNAPPDWSVYPFEAPGSTTTLPINIDDYITFKATADDPEDNGYRLLVCSVSTASPGAADGPPSCTGGVGNQLCVSASTTDETEASCSYQVATTTSETLEWYAFLCDTHPSQQDCTTYQQGDPATPKAATSSPLYINHQPHFLSISTTVDNQDPGGNFTLEAVVTDADVLGGQDTLNLYVCNSNSWASSTGCSVSLCSDSDTSPNVTCTFGTGTPAVDASYTYYAWVMDEHNYIATATRQSTYTVANVLASTSSAVLNSSNNIYLNTKGAAEVLASSSGQIIDNNGCTDITDATSTIYWSNATGTYECVADDNYCYHLPKTQCEIDAGSCTGSTDTSLTVTCTTTIAYHAIPTNNTTGNPANSTWWKASIRGFDESEGTVVATSTDDVVDVMTSTALDVKESIIAYGTVQAGQNTGATTSTTTVTNIGNGPLDSRIDGAHMTKGSDSIRSEQQRFGLAKVTYASLTYFLVPQASSSPTTLDMVTPRPLSSASTTDYIYWGINIPVGTPSGDYSGENYFVADLDTDGWYSGAQ